MERYYFAKYHHGRCLYFIFFSQFYNRIHNAYNYLLVSCRAALYQRYWQAVCPALLQPLELAGRPFVLRALQPVADKLSFGNFTHKARGFRAALPDFGHLLAWAHLRAAGHQGTARPEALRAFGAAPGWQHALLDFAAACQAGILPTTAPPR